MLNSPVQAVCDLGIYTIVILSIKRAWGTSRWMMKPRSCYEVLLTI